MELVEYLEQFLGIKVDVLTQEGIKHNAIDKYVLSQYKVKAQLYVELVQFAPALT